MTGRRPARLSGTEARTATVTDDDRGEDRGAGLRVGLFGILGSGNWGNDGSLDVVVSLLRERFPDAHLGSMVMGPEGLAARYGVPGVHLQWFEANEDRFRLVPSPLLKVVGRLLDPWRTLRWVREQDVVIIPGMGVFETSVPTRPWAMPASMLMLGVAARLTGARVAYVCVGADAPRVSPTHRVLRGAARLAHYRSWRDEMSKAAMARLGVDTRRDEVYPDLAFGLPTPVRRSSPGRVVGLGVMNFRGGEDDRAESGRLHAQYRTAVDELVRTLVDEGWTVRLFTGDREDHDVLRGVLAAAGDAARDGRVSEARVSSLDELMDVLVGVDAVVATRYHNVLTALKLGVPTVSVGYAAKNDVLMESMGLGDFCLAARSVTGPELVAAFHELERRGPELETTLAEANERNRAGVRRQLDALAAFLRRGR